VCRFFAFCGRGYPMGVCVDVMHCGSTFMIEKVLLKFQGSKMVKFCGNLVGLVFVDFFTLLLFVSLI